MKHVVIQSAFPISEFLQEKQEQQENQRRVRDLWERK